MPADATRYVTAAELKAWIAEKTSYVVDADGGDLATQLEQLIDDASEDFRERCGTEFHQTASQKREFWGRRDGSIWMAGSWLTSATPTIKIDTTGDDVVDTTLLATDYVLLPRVERNGATAVRWWRITMSRTSTKRFWPGMLVEVDGEWGYVDSDDAVPAGVQNAVLIGAARLFARRSTPLGHVAIPGAGISASMERFDADYERAVRKYMHPSMKAGWS